MRTTINIDDDLLETLKQYAETRCVALGKAASELMRRGLEAPIALRTENGFRVVDLPSSSPKVTTEQVRRLLEDEI